MTQAVVVLNPLSGHGRQAHHVDAHTTLAERVLSAHGIAATVRPTTAMGDAHRFSREAVAARVPLVVAWGGDGTVNEVASALVGTATALAIVPAGSGNGLASDLGIPRAPERALTLAATAPTRRIDAGHVDGCWFFNVAGVGVDALIAARFAGRKLHRRGPMAYLKLGLREVPRYRAERYEIIADGEALTRNVWLLAIANSRQYGNSVYIAPHAKVDDGALALVVAEPLSLGGVLWRLPALFRGTLAPDSRVTMRSVRTVTISRPGEIAFHVDGEPRVGRDQLTVGLAHHALALRAPAL